MTPRPLPPLPQLPRRRFLQATALAALATACGTQRGPDALDEPSVDDGSGLGLSVLNWADYIDPTEDPTGPGTIARFEAATGIPVDYVPDYEGNVEVLERLLRPTLGEGEPSGFDVIMPTYWLAQRMLSHGWIQQLPLQHIPNHVNVDPAFTGLEWDRGGRHQMPWQVGLTGIAYDRRRLGRELRSVEDLFADDLRGRVGFIGEMREAVGLVMLGQGADPSRATVDDARAALERIRRVADGVTFTFSEFADGLRSGDLLAAMAWSGDVVQLQADAPDVAFVVPDEGAIRWFDTMVLPTGAANPGGAARFMDFVYKPEQAARITAWVQYISPVLGVRDALVAQGDGALADNPILFPDDETAQRLFTWGGMDPDDEDAIEAEFLDIAGLA